MPIEAGATYVFDLGYYDYGWWSMLDQAGCRIVTRLKSIRHSRSRRTAGPAGNLDPERSNRPPAQAACRIPSQPDVWSRARNPSRDRDRQGAAHLYQRSAGKPQEIADLYKRRWAIELFFRWVKQTFEDRHFLGTSENAVRIQITIALIAFLLLRLAHDAHKIVASPLAFARLIRTNLMMRRQIAELLQSQSPPIRELHKAGLSSA